MPSFTIFIPGEPKGQPRPRAFSCGGMARVYDPGTAEGWKSQIALAVKPFLPPTPIETQLQLSARFFFSRPKGHVGKKGLKPSAPAHFTKKPDLDNVVKALCDALTTVRLWNDDSQVTIMLLSKGWATNGNAGTELGVQW